MGYISVVILNFKIFSFILREIRIIEFKGLRKINIKFYEEIIGLEMFLFLISFKLDSGYILYLFLVVVIL